MNPDNPTTGKEPCGCGLPVCEIHPNPTATGEQEIGEEAVKEIMASPLPPPTAIGEQIAQQIWANALSGASREVQFKAAADAINAALAAAVGECKASYKPPTTGEWTAIYNELVNHTADHKGNPITEAAARVLATNIHKLFNAALAAERSGVCGSHRAANELAPRKSCPVCDLAAEREQDYWWKRYTQCAKDFQELRKETDKQLAAERELRQQAERDFMRLNEMVSREKEQLRKQLDDEQQKTKSVGILADQFQKQLAAERERAAEMVRELLHQKAK